MTARELSESIEQLILFSDKRYTSSLNKIQRDLYNQVSIILKELDLDSDGYARQNAVNRKVLLKASDKIQEIFSSPLYTSSVSNYVNVIPKIDLLNVEYFQALDQSFLANRAFIKNLQKETIATVEKYILQDGLQSQVVQPLIQILNQNINSGGQFSGFLQQVRDYVIGNDQIDGRAMSYTRTYLRDSLFTYARTYHQAVTADLGLEWYMYVGGLMDTSRPFCIERAGKFYTHREIEQWASESWAGKKSGTTESSIFIFAGGHNCSHQIIPVSSLIVPDEDLARIKKPAEV